MPPCLFSLFLQYLPSLTFSFVVFLSSLFGIFLLPLLPRLFLIYPSLLHSLFSHLIRSLLLPSLLASLLPPLPLLPHLLVFPPSPFSFPPISLTSFVVSFSLLFWHLLYLRYLSSLASSCCFFPSLTSSFVFSFSVLLWHMFLSQSLSSLTSSLSALLHLLPLLLLLLRHRLLNAGHNSGTLSRPCQL